jgi:hypothetical protein
MNKKGIKISAFVDINGCDDELCSSLQTFIKGSSYDTSSLTNGIPISIFLIGAHKHDCISVNDALMRLLVKTDTLKYKNHTDSNNIFWQTKVMILN